MTTATRLDAPARIFFDWNLNEQGIRVSGKGVARVEPPYRARLDLFLGNGETIAQAALVHDDLRIPPGVPEGIIPPAPLLWGVLGVFRPGAGAALVGADRLEDGQFGLRYITAPGEQVHFRLRGGAIREVALLRDGHVVRRVEIDPGGDGRFPAEASYRDIEAFRELSLQRGEVETVESYPPDIWLPIGG